ncbi:MAG: YHS domain-containing (seleno)protein, partial [Pseudomonadota bacterium]
HLRGSTMLKLLRQLAAATVLIAAASTASAAALKQDEIWTDMHGRALKGYDAVAYHLERKPVRGEEVYELEWKGAKWLFSTAENMEKFRADPERWAPQYGGYCAWGIAKDRVVGINPTIFRIFDDKLYLNLNMKVHKEWLGSHHGFRARADDKWPDILVYD